MHKKIYVKLKATSGGIGAEYRVDQLRNAEHVWVGAKAFRVGCEVTQNQAAAMCEMKNVEVTINSN